MITSASASSDGGGGEEGGGDQGGDEEQRGDDDESSEGEGGESVQTASPEKDDEPGTEPDTETDDDQPVPTPETSPSDLLGIAPTPTQTPVPGLTARGLLPTLPSEWMLNCIRDPTLPECQPKTPTPTSSPFGTLRGGLTPGDQTLKGICILNPSDPRCQQTFPTKPPTPVSTSEANPKSPGGSQTPRILCVINPSHPNCQPNLEGIASPPQGASTSPLVPSTPTPAPGSQLLGPRSQTPDFNRALTPSDTTGEQITKAPTTPKILCVVNPSHPQCQSTQTSIGSLSPSPSSPSDPLLSGPKSGSRGSVPLADPALVPGPDEEGVASGEPCIAFPCFPYPLSQDEICRNGIDDDFDGKVDETIYCSEVPGESKPRPSNDGVLTPIPGSPLGPPQ